LHIRLKIQNRTRNVAIDLNGIKKPSLSVD
jgi:hypothetical protein